MCIRARVFMLWLRRRRLPEQVDRAGSIALVRQSRKLEEDRELHINTSNGAARGLPNKPIMTGGVEIRRLPCSFLSKSNGGARKGAVSATWLMGKSTGTTPVHTVRFLVIYFTPRRDMRRALDSCTPECVRVASESWSVARPAHPSHPSAL